MAGALNRYYLEPYKEQLLYHVAAIEQQEVRWHVAQLLPRLLLTPEERRFAVTLLTGYLQDRSKIVKTFAMQALADLALADASLRPTILTQLEELTKRRSPAMQSRGRKLLATLRSAK